MTGRGDESEAGVNERPPDAYGPTAMHGEATRLMLAAKDGDRTAFDTLVETVRGRAFQLARALVGSNDDAMELCQDAFLKVYRARETFREGQAFEPWFHRIVKNTCYSFLRDKKRVKPISDLASPGDEEDFDYQIVDDDAGPGDASESGERAAFFWKAFRALSARDREILALRHFQERSYAEIARALGIPQGTVMSRLFHARRRLREALDPSVFPPEETGTSGGRAR